MLTAAATQRRSVGPPGDYLLIVADALGPVMELSDSLSSAGYAVAAVRSVELALATIRLAPPALILFGLPLATAADRAGFRSISAACQAPSLLLDLAADASETCAESTRVLLYKRPPRNKSVAA
jgi:hypothetical protein